MADVTNIYITEPVAALGQHSVYLFDYFMVQMVSNLGWLFNAYPGGEAKPNKPNGSLIKQLIRGARFEIIRLSQGVSTQSIGWQFGSLDLVSRGLVL